VQGCFCLTGFAHHFVAVRARWQRFSVRTVAPRFLRKSFFKRLDLFETPATLHD
jgi:hypothetical protein